VLSSDGKYKQLTQLSQRDCAAGWRD